MENIEKNNNPPEKKIKAAYYSEYGIKIFIKKLNENPEDFYSYFSAMESSKEILMKKLIMVYADFTLNSCFEETKKLKILMEKKFPEFSFDNLDEAINKYQKLEEGVCSGNSARKFIEKFIADKKNFQKKEKVFDPSVAGNVPDTSVFRNQPQPNFFSEKEQIILSGKKCEPDDVEEKTDDNITENEGTILQSKIAYPKRKIHNEGNILESEKNPLTSFKITKEMTDAVIDFNKENNQKEKE